MSSNTTSDQDKSKTPATLKECLSPLAAGAAQAAINTYLWAQGSMKDRAARCQRIMDVAERAIEECNAILHEEKIRSEAEKPKEEKQ